MCICLDLSQGLRLSGKFQKLISLRMKQDKFASSVLLIQLSLMKFELVFVERAPGQPQVRNMSLHVHMCGENSRV